MGTTHRTWLGWLPAAVWMALIFIGSTDLLADNHTSRFIGPFLHWLIPGISEAAVDQVRFAIRKCAHMGEYAVLAYLVASARFRGFNPRCWRWSWQAAGKALLVCAVYALSDEWHQSFTPSRQATLRDVGFDTLGALAMLAVLWAWNRRFPAARHSLAAAEPTTG
ncbi:MAG: VanZ family protein [Verrucomicrobiales bacterium]|nr:VanZ family protein [Verrucomicrobiales bacterium]